MTSKRVPGTRPDTSCSIPDTRWRSCLTVLPYFTLKNPPPPPPLSSSPTTKQLKVYRTRFSYSSISPLSIKPIYDWPTHARDRIQIPHIWAVRSGSRIKKKERKDTKAYSTYKSWIIFFFFFRTDSCEFSIRGYKEKAMSNKKQQIPASLVAHVVWKESVGG